MQALFKNKGGGWKYLILDGKIECSSDGYTPIKLLHKSTLRLVAAAIRLVLLGIVVTRVWSSA